MSRQYMIVLYVIGVLFYIIYSSGYKDFTIIIILLIHWLFLMRKSCNLEYFYELLFCSLRLLLTLTLENSI